MKSTPPPSDTVPPAWREYFIRLVHETPRFAGPRRFLQRDLLTTMQRLIPPDAKVLEVGVGRGTLLAGLPNAQRHGLDILPEAIEQARTVLPSTSLEVADALAFSSSEKYDAIICDRLCHVVPDVQRLLDNLAAHLAPGGRIFLTCFNFLWSLPLMQGAKVGLVEPSPEQNFFSESDLHNLFELTGLEVVRSEDRMVLPLDVPGVAKMVNRFASLPGVRLGSLYRVYALRRREEARAKPKVSVVIPARNEAGNIEQAIQRTPVMGAGTEIIFVEGGSSDNTFDRIVELKGQYQGPLELKLFKQTGKGKGDAVRLGFAQATGDLLMILDADLTVIPEDLPKFYDAMVRGVTDYSQGTRLIYPMEDGAMRFLNKLGNAFFARAFSFLLGQPIKDTLCGTKVLWKKDYEHIVRNRSYFGEFDPFGDFDLIFGASRLNLKIIELPVRYRSRTYGETNIQRFRDGVLLLKMCAVAAQKIKFI